MQDVVSGLRATAAVCCEAVAEGLRGLVAGPDAQRGLRAAQRAVDIVACLSQRCAAVQKWAVGPMSLGLWCYARLRAAQHAVDIVACLLQPRAAHEG